MISISVTRLFSSLPFNYATLHSNIQTKTLLSLYLKCDFNSKKYHSLRPMPTCNSEDKLNNEHQKSDLLKKMQCSEYFYTPSASLRNKIDVVPSYKGIEVPEERQKLIFMPKVPHLHPGTKARKMMKNLDLIRGEEEVHTDYLHGQYGIVAQRGGFLRHGHLEMIRLGISRRINAKKMFAIWRIEAPWKTHFKKGQGKRMGGGKGNISYYTTPVKAKRVIIEVAGRCTFQEVKRMLDIIAHKLPFPATVMSQEMIEEERREEVRLEKENINPYTFKYVLQNNMLGSQMWCRKYTDPKYFGKYV